MARPVDIEYTFLPQGLTDTEKQFIQAMERLGYRIMGKGWPDFICQDGSGKVTIVEVKKEPDSIKPHQLACLVLLSLYGFDARIYYPSKDRLPGRHLTEEEQTQGMRILRRDTPTRLRARLAFNLWKDLQATETQLFTIEQLASLTGISQLTLLALCIHKRIKTTPQECDGQNRLYIRWRDFCNWVTKSAQTQYAAVSGKKTVKEFIETTESIHHPINDTLVSVYGLNPSDISFSSSSPGIDW